MSKRWQFYKPNKNKKKLGKWKGSHSISMKLIKILMRKNLSFPLKRRIKSNSIPTIMDNFIGSSLEFGFGISLVILAN